MRLTRPLARRPLLSYFVLVFLVAWGAVLVVVGPAGLVRGATPEPSQLLPVFGAMLLGPAVAGLALVTVVDGRQGLRDLWARQLRWRVAPRWYGVAVLTTPMLLVGILGTLSLLSPTFVPRIVATDDVVGVVAFGLLYGLFAGVFEEVGWTGFALPRLRRRYSLLVAGIVLGVLWGGWHGLADYWGTSVQFGDLWAARIALWTAALTAYRVLIAWVYENTGSLLLAQLMHASFTGSQGLLVPSLSPADHFRWYAIFTVVLWVIVAVVALSIETRERRTEGTSMGGPDDVL